MPIGKLNNRTLAAFFTLLFLVLSISLNLYFLDKRKPITVTKQFQKRLDKKETILTALLDQLKIIVSAKGDAGMQDLLRYQKTYKKEGFIILIYNKDSLLLWSDNSVSSEKVYTEISKGNHFTHFQNGWYDIIYKKENDLALVGLMLIKSDFAYQNNYLINSFQKEFKVSKELHVLEEKGLYPIYSKDKSYLFSLGFPETTIITDRQVFILFTLYLLSLLFLIAFIFQVYLAIEFFLKRRILMFLFFFMDVLIIRVIIFYFKIPISLYQSDLFSPLYYGSSVFLPSFGDLIVNAFILLIIAYIFNTSLRTGNITKPESKLIRHIIAFILMVIVILLFRFIVFLFQGLVLDSNISFNLNNIFSLSSSSLLGFIVIASLLLAFFLFTHRLADFIHFYVSSISIFFGLLILVFITDGLLCNFITGRYDIVYSIFLLAVLVSFWFLSEKRLQVTSFYSIIFYLFLFSIICTYFLHQFNHIRELNQRRLMAVRLAAERDNITEYKFTSIEKAIYSDTALIRNLPSALLDRGKEDKITDYIVQKFLKDYRSNYNIQVTICDRGRNLEIEPDNIIINCRQYFVDQINQDGEQTDNPHLYYLNKGSNDVNYIAFLSFSEDYTGALYPIDVFIELNSKYVPKALGYPELLMDRRTYIFTDLTNYSYAIYVDSCLVKSVGKYLYTLPLPQLKENEEEFISYKQSEYNHLAYKANHSTWLIISMENPHFLDIVAPFSYLLIFFGLYVLIFMFITHSSFSLRRPQLDFKTRLQIAIMSIIIVSCILIGATSLLYIVNLNDKKNLDILNEKTHSVLVEVEHKLSNESSLTPDMQDYLASLLTKFSIVFFSDINLYDPAGYLLASSRPEIFKEGLLSTRMNAVVYNEFTFNKMASFIHSENIGRYRYLSAYLPFRNNQNKIIAYVNLPYFAKQTELRQEVSIFLIAFTNIYIFLAVITIFITLFIANYVTLPLKVISNKIGRLRLGKGNEKIEWSRKDEIGNLVEEYNRMIDELVKSAELLAKSERESAWREMAKQVAHEIKNPLTPMKLSVQYLQKAWEEGVPDWDERLKRFSQTVIQQIDNLSDIASEFSDFAKMPQTKLEKVELTSVIQDAIDLYKDIQPVHLICDPYVMDPCVVFADRKQLLRVFNNLIKNSVQAIKESKSGRIEIRLTSTVNAYNLEVKDNGIGIPDDQKDKIFMPSFTTKSGGMGLGLAIVKSIIESIQGQIWFKSQEGVGTSFYIHLPKYSND
ncbi:MAG: ATP-binding protein [Bacteroidetes bacterium]|nr:ATP-binding protein [Bacteroidota bacterium]